MDQVHFDAELRTEVLSSDRWTKWPWRQPGIHQFPKQLPVQIHDGPPPCFGRASGHGIHRHHCCRRHLRRPLYHRQPCARFLWRLVLGCFCCCLHQLAALHVVHVWSWLQRHICIFSKFAAESSNFENPNFVGWNRSETESLHPEESWRNIWRSNISRVWRRRKCFFPSIDRSKRTFTNRL